MTSLNEYKKKGHQSSGKVKGQKKQNFRYFVLHRKRVKKTLLYIAKNICVRVSRSMGRTQPPYIRVTLPYTVAMKKKKKGIRKGECGMKNWRLCEIPQPEPSGRTWRSGASGQPWWLPGEGEYCTVRATPDRIRSPPGWQQKSRPSGRPALI